MEDATLLAPKVTTNPSSTHHPSNPTPTKQNEKVPSKESEPLTSPASPLSDHSLPIRGIPRQEGHEPRWISQPYTPQRILYAEPHQEFFELTPSSPPLAQQSPISNPQGPRLPPQGPPQLPPSNPLGAAWPSQIGLGLMQGESAALLARKNREEMKRVTWGEVRKLDVEMATAYLPIVKRMNEEREDGEGQEEGQGEGH